MKKKSKIVLALTLIIVLGLVAGYIFFGEDIKFSSFSSEPGGSVFQPFSFTDTSSPSEGSNSGGGGV